MEGIPAPDVADYKRRKEQELGLPAGSISGSGKGLPQNKRPRIENRVLSEEELRAQLHAHRALMGGGDTAPAPAPAHGGAVYNAAPQTYATPAAPSSGPPFPPGMMPPPPGAGPFPGGPPPPGFSGQPPFPPFPPGPGFPPGCVDVFILLNATSAYLPLHIGHLLLVSPSHRLVFCDLVRPLQVHPVFLQGVARHYHLESPDLRQLLARPHQVFNPISIPLPVLLQLKHLPPRKPKQTTLESHCHVRARLSHRILLKPIRP